MAVENDWLSAIRGHVRQYRQDIGAQRKQWEQARANPQNTIIDWNEVDPANWDGSRILYTTLGGNLRQITASDIATFKLNRDNFFEKFNRKLGGIKAQQVIDFAASTPLEYKNQDNNYKSDIDKARREITQCIPVSAVNGVVRFITNASPESQRKSHTVVVEFLGFNYALNKVLANSGNDKEILKAVKEMTKGYLKFNCDCGRHQYFFRYLATVGNWNHGQGETGYPKIRNPNMKGVACKHVLRVMSDIVNSGVVQRFLVQHLTKYSKARTSTNLGKKQVQELAKRKRTTRVKTTKEIREERRTRRQLAKARQEIKQKVKTIEKKRKVAPPKKMAVKSRRYSPKIENNIASIMSISGKTRQEVIDFMGLEKNA